MNARNATLAMLLTRWIMFSFWTVKERYTVAVAAMAMVPLYRGSLVRFCPVSSACKQQTVLAPSIFFSKKVETFEQGVRWDLVTLYYFLVLTGVFSSASRFSDFLNDVKKHFLVILRSRQLDARYCHRPAKFVWNVDSIH